MAIKKSGLGELLEFGFENISLTRIYNVADLLLKHKEALESHLYQEEKKCFHFKETITLYDLTNTYFEGTGEYNDLAFRGRSKEKRNDRPLVTLALVLDSSGFPKISRFFRGNVGEAGTLKEIIKT